MSAPLGLLLISTLHGPPAGATFVVPASTATGGGGFVSLPLPAGTTATCCEPEPCGFGVATAASMVCIGLTTLRVALPDPVVACDGFLLPPSVSTRITIAPTATAPAPIASRI